MQRAVPNRRKDCVRAQSTQFYTKLSEPVVQGGGPASVGAWAARKNMDIFEKKLVFVPINYTGAHWSLCVVVNPGAIDNPSIDKGSPLACILFFDSFGGKDTRVFAQVRMWLNYEWR
jgi:Ulp1 family protease